MQVSYFFLQIFRPLRNVRLLTSSFVGTLVRLTRHLHTVFYCTELADYAQNFIKVYNSSM